MAITKMSVRLIHTLITVAAICMLLLSLCCEAADVPENEIDKLALLAFKSQINDDPRGVFSSWNDSSDFCNWTGVTCGSNITRVTILNLTQRGLAGSISRDLGNLSFINVLDLSGNFLNGEIPQELGNLGRLRNLNVSNNLLAGRIPVSLSNCSRLRNLSLDHNYLMGTIPREIGWLSNLVTLNLGSNNLTGTFPSSFGNLTVLEELDMSYNLLNGEVPSSVTQLRNLRVFRLSVNSLSGEFPPSLYNLTSLEFIALSFNNFTGNLRNDIGLVLPNLQRLWLPFNFFTGPIPNTLSNASNLQNIDLIRNNFTGKVPLNLGELDLLQLSISNNYLGTGEPDDLDFITALTNCSNLRVLNFGHNQLTGTLPVSVANLSTDLTRLYMDGNSIHGSIPRDIVNLQNLNILYMNWNNFSGTIPDSLGMLPNLGRLVMFSNQLTGQIPSSFGNMTSLLWLFLFDNRLEGGIPSSLANLNQIVFFSVSQNNLTGIIPQEFMSVPSLLSINMSFNSLTGPLPENIGNLTHLVEIDLSYNGFSGEIPNTLGDCLGLNIIFLHGNYFHGRIPNFARLQNLQYLDLSRNNLSGNIPDYLASLPSFLYLNLSFNNFDGVVPSTGVFSNVSALDIQNNPGLCGGAPELNLPSCPSRAPLNVNRSRVVKHLKLILAIVIPLFVALSSFLLVIILMTKKISKQVPDLISRDPNSFPKLSYNELLKATDGFSSENLIGTGGFGSVYRGTLHSTEVAIKVLNLEQKGASKSFLAECLALKNIRHYNLVKVITACSSLDFNGNDFKALVYQLMPNGSLDEWLHPEKESCERSLNILQRIDIVIDVASALHYLHHQCQTPIIHCDLKPQNVLLDDDLTARIGDFGLARLFPRFIVKENANQFSSLGIKGTIGYAPPEYAMGLKASLVGDVYSFGILLLEIFTGLRPTDDLFQENMNLHQFVKVAIPDKVAYVLDNSALCEEVTGESETWEEGWSNIASEKCECLIRILQIGVACSVDSPRERMSMRQVCRELSLLRDIFTGTVFEEEKKPSFNYRAIEYTEDV